MICLKIRTFVVSATTGYCKILFHKGLWFAWKFVPLWYQQQLNFGRWHFETGCDLLENSYLCGISNNNRRSTTCCISVVICLKIRTFVVSATTYDTLYNESATLWFAWKFVPLWYQQQQTATASIKTNSCDLLENSYLCGISNNLALPSHCPLHVVICLKIRTFVVSATTYLLEFNCKALLWFAWKFVPLWYQQQLIQWIIYQSMVVICLKIRTFVVSATT